MTFQITIYTFCELLAAILGLFSAIILWIYPRKKAVQKLFEDFHEKQM